MGVTGRGAKPRIIRAGEKIKAGQRFGVDDNGEAWRSCGRDWYTAAEDIEPGDRIQINTAGFGWSMLPGDRPDPQLEREVPADQRLDAITVDLFRERVAALEQGLIEETYGRAQVTRELVDLATSLARATAGLEVARALLGPNGPGNHLSAAEVLTAIEAAAGCDPQPAAGE